MTLALQEQHRAPRVSDAKDRMPGCVQRGARTTDLLLLAAVLAALVAANREWLFNGLHWVDAWIYVGFFRHYDFAPMLAYDKKIARLPWILLGYLVNHAAPPVAAQFILHLGMLAAGAAALYVVLVKQYGRAIGFLISAFYLTYMPAQGNGGWDYNTTPSGLLYVLTYASLLKLSERPDRPRAKGFLAGLAGATLIHTNLLFILVVPALLFFVAVRIRGQLAGPALRHWTRETLLGAVCSAAGLTLLLALINVMVGRDFFFFGRLIGVSANLILHPDGEKAWWRPWSESWWHEYQMPLILIVLVLTALTALLSRASRTKIMRKDNRIVAILFISLAIFAAFQTIGHPVLQPGYMAFPLLLPTMFALAALTKTLLTPVGGVALPEWNGAWSFATAATFAVLFVFQSAAPVSWHFGLLKHHDYILNLLPIVIAFLGVWALMRTSDLPRWLTTAVSASLLVLAMAETNAQWPTAQREAYSYRNACRVRQAIFPMVIEADRILFPRLKAGERIPLVYHVGEMIRLGGCEVSLAEVARPVSELGYGVAMAYYYSMEALPKLPDKVVDEVARKQTQLAIITRDSVFRDRLLARLRERLPEWHIDSESMLGSEAAGARLIVLSRHAAVLSVSG